MWSPILPSTGLLRRRRQRIAGEDHIVVPSEVVLGTASTSKSCKLMKKLSGVVLVPTSSFFVSIWILGRRSFYRLDPFRSALQRVEIVRPVERATIEGRHTGRLLRICPNRPRCGSKLKPEGNDPSNVPSSPR